MAMLNNQRVHIFFETCFPGFSICCFRALRKFFLVLRCRVWTRPAGLCGVNPQIGHDLRLNGDVNMKWESNDLTGSIPPWYAIWAFIYIYLYLSIFIYIYLYLSIYIYLSIFLLARSRFLLVELQYRLGWPNPHSSGWNSSSPFHHLLLKSNLSGWCQSSFSHMLTHMLSYFIVCAL